MNSAGLEKVTKKIDVYSKKRSYFSIGTVDTKFIQILLHKWSQIHNEEFFQQILYFISNSTDIEFKF